MNKNIEQLLTLVATANDKLMQENKALCTTVGLLEQSLQGSNAVTVDNVKLGERLMFIILDAHPEVVGIGVGQKGSEEFTFISQLPLVELNKDNICALMFEHLSAK